jgi:transposase
MGQHSEAFVGIDTSKKTNVVSIAEAGRNGELRRLGAFDTSEASTRKWIGRLAQKYRKLTFCYEAGPTGYELHRLIESMGHACIVIAPALIPKRPGERVKTNGRDADNLARLCRAGELVAVWVPDKAHEAMRDLSRAREAGMVDLKAKRQRILSLLLRHGHVYPGQKTWGKKHRTWLRGIKIAEAGTRIAFEEQLAAEEEAQARLDRLVQHIRELVAEWSLAELMVALMALRGIDLITAVTLLAEIGDMSRFKSARELMAYLGLVPSEHSTGDSVRRGPITKAGNKRARRALVEAAWSYRHPPRVGVAKQARVAAAPKIAREIAWKAQGRLSARFRKLASKGKPATVVVTAIARELVGFVWDICRQVPVAGAGRQAESGRPGPVDRSGD